MRERAITDPAITRQVNNLRNHYAYTHFADNPLTVKAVGALLVHLMSTEDRMAFQPPFAQVSTHLCNFIYDLRDAQMKKRVAATALAVAHVREYPAQDVEERTGLHRGLLARLKSGQPLTITPVQVVALAADLEVALDILFRDFTNQPEELRRELAAVLDDPVSDDPVAPTVFAASPVVELSQPAAASAPIEEEEVVMEVVARADVPAAIAPPGEVAARQVALNVRAHAKQAKVGLAELLKSVGIKNRLHLENIVRGTEPALTDSQLAVFAEKLGMSVAALRSGEGLSAPARRKRVSTTALVPVGAKALLLPPLTSERRNGFFRERCLRRNVELADGRQFGELLEAAANPDQVDWYTLWSTVTKEGAAFRLNLERILQMAKPWGDVMRSAFIEETHKQLFQSTES